MPAGSTWLVALVVGALGATACSDGDSDPLVDAAPATDGGTTAPDGASAPNDMNDSFAQARTIATGNPVTGAIQKPGDRDYYAVELTADTWIRLFTSANPMDDPDMVDTVITLFDENLTQLAQNDDEIPRQHTDSSIVFHVPASGTYYIEVQEFSTFGAGESPRGEPGFSYRLEVSELATGDGITIEEEAGNTAAEATPVSFSDEGATYLLGRFEAADDVDHFAVTTSHAAGQYLEAIVLPAGIDGQGSTLSVGVAAIDDDSELPVIARIDAATGSDRLAPPVVAATRYTVSVAHPAGLAPGDSAFSDNAFYVVKLFEAADHDPEREDSTNGTLATAEPLALVSGKSSFVTQLEANTDVDFFSFPASSGDRLSLSCASESAGSGVIGLQAAVLRPDGELLPGAVATETATKSIALRDLTLQTDGTHALRFTREGQEPEISGRWVRCLLQIERTSPLGPYSRAPWPIRT